MKARWPYLALIVALLTVGSLLPSASGAMELEMAAAVMADMEMPDCDGCDGCDELSATCAFGCATAQMALAGLPDDRPVHVACADDHPAVQTRLVGIARPPDTAPPRSRSWR